MSLMECPGKEKYSETTRTLRLVNVMAIEDSYNGAKSVTEKSFSFQLFRERLSGNCARDNPEKKMGYAQYTVPDDCSCRTYFCCSPLALTNICSWPPVPFFQISLKNSALKTTHNTFRDCRLHFFRQPFLKQDKKGKANFTVGNI